jgi:hypothetical protein
MRRTLSKNAASQKPHQYLPSTMRICDAVFFDKVLLMVDGRY